MFAEEVGGFGMVTFDGLIYRCFALITLRIHIGTLGD